MAGTETPEPKIAHRLRLALYWSAGAFAVLLVLVLIFIFSSRYIFIMPYWFVWTLYALLTAFVCTLITGIARFAYAIFGQLQAPLSEWMLTFFVPAGLLPLIMAVFPTRSLENTENTVAWLIIMVLLIFLTFLGSAWGWQTMKRLGEQRPWPRFWLLVRGWLLVPGVAGVSIFLLASFFMVIEVLTRGSLHYSPEDWHLYLGSGTTSVLALPAALVEWRIRRQRKP